MLHNDPHNATETTKSLNCFLLDFCCGGHNFSSSDVPYPLKPKKIIIIIKDVACVSASQARTKLITFIKSVACAPPPNFQTELLIFINYKACVSPPQTLAKLISVIEGVGYASPSKNPCKANYCHVECGMSFMALVCVNLNTNEGVCNMSITSWTLSSNHDQILCKIWHAF